MFDIYNFKRLYRKTKREIGATGSTVRLQLKPIKTKTIRILSHIAVENKTTAYTKIRLGIKNIGIDYYLDELQTIAANELVTSKSNIILGEGDQFFAELTGTTTDDILIMTCIGWEQKL